MISRKRRANQRKKYRVMFFYSIENGMQSFRRFGRKKEKHLKSSLSMVLRSPLQLFAYSVLLCRFFYICRAGEKTIILRFSFSGLFLEIIWLHIIWYLAANLPQEKSYRCNKNFGLFFVFVFITQFAFLSLCKSILAFRHMTQII